MRDAPNGRVPAVRPLQNRREILARLEREETLSISALAAPFAIKLPAVMKHLDVLSAAGLITRSKSGIVPSTRAAYKPKSVVTKSL